MSIRRRLTSIVGIGLVVAAVATTTAFVAPQASLAQTATPSAQSRGPRDAGIKGDTYLADALGITAEELTAARQKANEAAITQALEKGLITQAQADALRSKTDGMARGLGDLKRLSGAGQLAEKALLAEALGITTDNLDEAMKAAEEARIAQAVADGRLTQEQADLQKAREALQQYIQDKGFFAEAVARAVKDGVITQAQADAILAADQGKGGFELGGFGGHGGRGGRGGPGGAGMGERSGSVAPTASGTGG